MNKKVLEVDEPLVSEPEHLTLESFVNEADVYYIVQLLVAKKIRRVGSVMNVLTQNMVYIKMNPSPIEVAFLETGIRRSLAQSSPNVTRIVILDDKLNSELLSQIINWSSCILTRLKIHFPLVSTTTTTSLGTMKSSVYKLIKLSGQNLPYLIALHLFNVALENLNLNHSLYLADVRLQRVDFGPNKLEAFTSIFTSSYLNYLVLIEQYGLNNRCLDMLADRVAGVPGKGGLKQFEELSTIVIINCPNIFNNVISNSRFEAAFKDKNKTYLYVEQNEQLLSNRNIQSFERIVALCERLKHLANDNYEQLEQIIEDMLNRVQRHMIKEIQLINLLLESNMNKQSLSSVALHHSSTHHHGAASSSNDPLPTTSVPKGNNSRKGKGKERAI